ncbi:response regulator transcription factor [Xenophilus sp. Marseille-Q4582]|uniref:response regulator n=1 Tax=Xenophilus sp. Marseille-Q4582 TaxID=2866600 RepID=UPI001CE41F35|nr:response regulator transcription factor [Xenophilus sp. Marseille-Q4582]
MTQILIIDDDPALRLRLQHIVERVYGPGLCCVADSLAAARGLLSLQAFDLALLDVGLPDGNGVTLLPWVRERVPALEVVIVSSLGDDATVLQAIRAGAVGYLLKNGDDMELELSLRSLQRGGAPIDPVIARRILLQLSAAASPASAEGDPLPGAASAAAPELTERELEVLKLVAQGYSNREISESLGVTINTIEAHAKKIFRKLEVRSRSAAVHSATQKGWLG